MDAKPTKKTRTTKTTRTMAGEPPLALLHSLIAAIPHAVAIINVDNTILFANQLLEHLFGYSTDELVNQPVDMLFSARSQTKNKPFSKPSANKQILKLSGVSKDGKEFPLTFTCNPIAINAQKTLLCCTLQDSSHTHYIFRKIKQLMNVDTMTQLPNRARFNKVLTKRITLAKKENSHFALLLLNINRMKFINDYYNYHIGDMILKKVGTRIAEQIRAHDFLARIGFDEFAIIMETESPHQPGILAKRLIASFDKPLQAMDNIINISISIGIAIFPNGGHDATSLLKNADIALYKAKSLKTRQFAWYSYELNAQHTSRLFIENNLALAIKNEEFKMVYQPQVALKTQTICGVEALLRWNNTETGNIAPDIFIPIAENEGLIGTLGLWVFEQVCLQIQTWQNANIPILPVSLNLSTNQLNEPNLTSAFLKLCKRYQVNPQQIGLEITETNIMNLESGALEVVDTLSKAGFILSIDDFGSGYSSLSRLNKIPVKILKIDKSLVQDTGVHAKKILAAIINLANHMGLEVIAEGVDTAEKCEFLLQAGCKIGQGYYFYQPLSVEVLNTILEKGSPP